MPPRQRRRRPVSLDCAAPQWSRGTLTPVQADEEESDEDSRPRQRRNRDLSDDNPEDDSDEPMDADGDRSQNADNQLAKKLIRYAISCEYSRTAIRRDGIKERGAPFSSRTTSCHWLNG